MPANRQNNPNFFGGAGITEIEYDVNGNPTGTMPARDIGQTQATPAGGFLRSWFAAPTGPENNSIFSSQNVDALGNQGGPSNDSPVQAPTRSGTGAGKTKNPVTSVNPDDSPTPTGPTTQISVSTSAASLDQFVATQPNQLDQYASYTYSISWYVLTPAQYNNAIATQRPNVAGWQLLMQSGGAPIKGRSPAFPVDFYMDDLEIESIVPFGGVNMANSANKIRFKVVEPNGITLIQSLYNAVVAAYKNSQQLNTSASASGTPNYLEAQYCLVIEFYGYDSNGNLVAPARGSDSGYGQKAVIVKYYPFRLLDIKFSVANRAIEYSISGMAIPYSYNSSTDRGTVPFACTLTGQTVEQLLNGSPAASNAGTNTVDPGARTDKPQPKAPAKVLVRDLPVTQQAAIAAGTDPNTVNEQGMAFGGGGL